MMIPKATKAMPWLSIAPAAAIVAPAWAHGLAGDDGVWSSHMWGWGHMLFGALFMILFWGGLIALIVLAVRWIGRDRTPPAEPPATGTSARNILDERFARGEIDREEYVERKRLLSE